MAQDRPTGEDTADPDPREVRDRADLAAALLLLKDRSNLSYRRLERVTADAPGARFGLPFTTIRDYVQGRSLPTADRLDQIVWACRVTDPEARAEWARALRRAVDAGSQVHAADPYRGLAAYGVDDADRFRGRDRLLAELVGRVQALAGTGGLLAVVGTSGAGTTSLLRAGLVATLCRERLGRGAPERAVRYGTLGADPPGRLAELLGAGRRRDAARPVVVLDQLEEVFAAPVPARAAFLTMLEQAVTGPAAAVVVVGIRAGAAHRARAEPVLAVALDGSELTVPPLTADELRAAIVEPATAAGRAVGDGLVELLLHELRPDPEAGAGEAAHAPGMLPLLSLALSAAWTNAGPGELTVADYRAGGGLDGAAARVAETVVTGLGADQQRVARAVLQRLVRVGEDGEPVRRSATAAELAALPGAPAVVERLVSGRVLTESAGTVGITHSALLHAWPRLTGWLAEDRTGHAVRGTVIDAAHRWQDGDRDPGLLLRDGALAAAVGWAVGAAGTELASAELEFLRAGLDGETARHATERARLSRLRVAVAVLGVLVVALAGLIPWLA